MNMLRDDWELVEEAKEQELGLWRCADGWTVTGIDRQHQSVYSVMPNDRPKGGGNWVGFISSKGVDHVSRPYSYSYARRVYKKLKEEF